MKEIVFLKAHSHSKDIYKPGGGTHPKKVDVSFKV